MVGVAIELAKGDDSIDFRRDVQPLLKIHCFSCHGPEKQQGGLRFDISSGAFAKSDSGEPAIVSGDPEKSELLRRVLSTDEFDRMPPKGDRLSAAQIDVLRRWIKAGASWPQDTLPPEGGRQELVVTDEDRRHWSFQPLRGMELPPVRDSSWVRTPIDRFILAALEAAGRRPSPPLSPPKLLRRASFDVVGLPPQADASTNYEALVDSLLASPHYGERWGRHWLDVARYADSNGQEGDQDRPTAYHYRDFVIRSFNDDLPYNDFVRLQLAGDEIAPDNAEALAATGFLAAGPSTVLNVPMEDEKLRNRYNELDDMLSTVGTGLLGLTLGCARCHDHKYDPISSRDYYRLLSAVHNGDRAEVPLAPQAEVAEFARLHSAWEKEYKPVEKRLNDWLEEAKQPLEKSLLSSKIDALKISDEEKALLHNQIGNGRPGDGAAKKLAQKHAKALKITDDEFRRHMTDEQRLRWDELSAAVQQLRKREPQAPPTAFAFRDFGPEPKTTWLFQRGDYYDRDEPVELGFLTVLTSKKSPEDYFREAREKRLLPASSYQRRALAEWITDTEHGAGALLARVIVNRVWQHHFGEGLVRTVNDFGVQGEQPTHPELLEWLAHDFVAGGWKLKRLQRMILLSSTYRQSREGTPQRLEAEVLRDSMLAVSGKLNFQTYGPAFKPPIAPEAMVARNVKGAYPTDIEDSPDTFRRSVYMFRKRVVPYPLLQAFDAPDSLQSCGRRDRTTVAPQALALLNDPFVRDRSVDFADRLLESMVAPQRGAFDAHVTKAYELALNRQPTAEEMSASVAFLHLQQERRQARDPSQSADAIRRLALADFCQTLFFLNEFIYVD